MNFPGSLWSVASEAGRQALWCLDLAKGTIAFTRQQTKMFGLEEGALNGSVRRYLRLIPGRERREMFATLKNRLASGEDEFEHEHRAVRPDGITRHLQAQVRVLRDSSGAPEFLVGAYLDVSEAEAHSRAAVEASFDAIALVRAVYEGDAFDGFVLVDLNRNAEILLGVERANVLGVRLEAICPRPGSGSLEQYARVFKTNEPLDQEFQWTDAAGTKRWTHEQVVPIPGGLAITHADITDRKLSEERLRESELFTQRITTSTPDWVFIYDLQLDRTAYVNREPLRDLGYSAREISELGSDGYFRLIHPEDRALIRALQAPKIRGDEVGEFTYRLLSASGAYRWVSTRFVLFQQDADGQPLQVLATTRDVTPQKLTEERLQLQMRSLNDAQIELQRRQNELETLNERLATLATRDGLTGLHNHRSLQDRLTEEVSRSDRTGRPASLIMVDVDRFKSYNDRYGHPAGDLVLRELAAVLATTARASDFVARYGGEEFAVLLPDSRASDAAFLAERMRNKLNEVFFGEEKVTASFGCAEYIPGEMTKAELIQEADRALYRAKRDGRNCVRVGEHQSGTGA